MRSGTRGARRARGHPVGGGRAAVPRRGGASAPPSGCWTSSPDSVSPTRTSRRPPDGSRRGGRAPGPDPTRTRPTVLLYAHYDVQPPLDDGGMADPALRAHRSGRPLVRPGRRRLQGQHRHAPARPAGARRRRAGEPEAGGRGVGGTGHRRARGVRRRATPTCSAPTPSWSATPATPPWATRRRP